ncbi:MAG: hypothetical protein WCW13_07290 [archaeon]|jgi:DNA-binding transcriptional regulator GbsR (MarR family)
MKESFNFGFSGTLYFTFQTIYFRKEISLKQLSGETNCPKTSISEQIRVLKKRNLILDKYQNREKIFSINQDELKKWTKINNVDELNSIVLSSRRFSQFINNCKKKGTNKGLHSELLMKQFNVPVSDQEKIKLFEENLALKTEIAYLNEKLKQIKKLI